MSGHCDSIRERRARESWEEWEGEKTTETVIAVTIGTLVAQVFAEPEEAAAAAEKLVLGRLGLDYLEWNGRTDLQFLGVVR